MSDIRVDVAPVLRGLDRWVALIEQRLEAAASEIAHVLEVYAINHHPWEIDTGQTNETTKGRIQEFAKELITITLSAGMDYDQFLELAHDGRWAWLWPAILANTDTILQILRNRLSGGGAMSGGLSASAMGE